MLERVVAVMGPPAAGKTTLTIRLQAMLDCEVFRLREHVPTTSLAAAAAHTDRVDWIDDLTVARALRGYVERMAFDDAVRTVLLDNFPGSDTQVRLLFGTLRRLAPDCQVHAVELMVDELVRERRLRSRRVCHRCEQDPIQDPRIPAVASPDDPEHCAQCGSVLHPRRGDAPRLVAARTRHFEAEIGGVRSAFAEASVQVLQLEADQSSDELAADVSVLIAIGR
jgi:adenylate kinase family enzyme